MSPTKRPSAVAGLQRAVAAPHVHQDDSIGQQENIGRLVPERPPRPARVTLNMPTTLYRQLQRWADDAAETLDRPRVGVQDALRAMLRAGLSSDPAVQAAVLEQLRQED